MYPATHPAARQYVARRAELRWPRTCDEAKVLLAPYQAHTKAADDWIPFDRYLSIETPWTGTSFQPHFAPISGNNFVCRGPDFLVRTYAKALEAIGEQVPLTLRRASKLKPAQPKVLHFGESYVVAEAFRAERRRWPASDRHSRDITHFCGWGRVAHDLTIICNFDLQTV